MYSRALVVYHVVMRWRQRKDKPLAMVQQAPMPEPSCSLLLRRPGQSEADYQAEVARRREEARKAYEGVVQAWHGDTEALVHTFADRWWPKTSDATGVSS